MTDFNLDDFLANYKPKKLDLSYYLKCPKLKNYTFMDNNIDALVPLKTYVKYVKIDEENTDKKYNTHIKSGGILLAGGIYRDKFIKRTNNKTWTHLMLKYDPSKITDDNGNIVDGRLDEPIIFTIKIASNYIFYKKFGNDKRDQMKNLMVELVK